MLLVSQANVQDAGEPMTLDKQMSGALTASQSNSARTEIDTTSTGIPPRHSSAGKCNRRFTGKPGFEHRRHDPSMIIFCLMAFGFGISPNNISLMFANCGNQVHRLQLRAAGHDALRGSGGAIRNHIASVGRLQTECR